jgi:predicted amidohydrolase
MRKYQALARDEGVWLSLGGYQEAGPAGESRIFNTHVVIDAEGTIQATYRKIHLYDVPMVGLVESKQALAGEEVVSCDSPAGKLGVAICYDMRFPELSQKLTFLHGARVLTFPSAFAMKTGEAHWETLLRARAIECQTYVVAAAQAGLHNHDGNRRRSWGHALAVDPWGAVVASFGAEDTGVQTFEIDLDHVDATRRNMPMHAHRRYDLYGAPAVYGNREAELPTDTSQMTHAAHAAESSAWMPLVPRAALVAVPAALAAAALVGARAAAWLK